MSSDDKTQIISTPEAVGPGTQLNGIYEIDERIAFGGMGEVYRGHNIQTDDPVAIKIVLPEFARDQTILALFRKEASILSHLSHDAIVRYHVFTIDPTIKRPYLAMEFVNGESLADHFKQGPMDADTARRLIARVAAGLNAAHEAGVIHRDLSPDNVILPGGNVSKAKIIDFGIAKSATVGGGTLLGGKFAGKYNFVSPEQLGDYGGEITARSDIYSLGLVFAAALRGEPLDMGGSQVDVIEKRRKIPDISDLDPTLLPLLEAMLQPDPAHRPPSMEAIVQWLSVPNEVAAYVPGGGGTNGERQPGYVTTTPRSQPPGSQPPGPLAAGSVPPGSVAAPGSFPPQSVPPPGGAAQSSSTPPLPLSESPFGPGPVSPPGTSQVPPPPPQLQQGRGSSRGGLVALLVLLLVAGGGGAAYYSGALDGVLGRSVPVQPEVPAEEIAEDEEEAPAEEDVVVAPDPEPPVEEPEPPVAEAPDPEPPVEEPEPPVAEAPDPEPVPPLDSAAGWVEWLRAYDGGECFYAAATSVGDNALEVEGFATSAAPFEQLLAEFSAAYDFEPQIGVRLIEQDQCAVADFLHALRESSEDRPRLSLSSDIISSGDAIRGALENLEGRSTNILLIDNAGVVYNLAPHLRQEQNEASFNIKLGLNTPTPVPQIIIALASSGELETANVSDPIFASTLFPRILEEIRRSNMDTSAAAKYFRLGG